MIKQCLICNKDFKTYLSRVRVGKGKYCSKECCYIALTGRESKRRGIKMSEEMKKRMNMDGLALGWGWNRGLKTGIRHDKQFKKGHVPWNKGVRGYTTSYKGSKRPDAEGDKNKAWVGDDVGYGGLHDWIRSRLGSPLECSVCGDVGSNSRRFHWHNITGEYKRDLDDWTRVCAKCHKKLHKEMVAEHVE